MMSYGLYSASTHPYIHTIDLMATTNTKLLLTAQSSIWYIMLGQVRIP